MIFSPFIAVCFIFCFIFQCFAPRCLEIFPSLSTEQRNSLYCTHLVEAQTAVVSRQNAEKKSVALKALRKILQSDKDYQILADNSSNGNINIFVLPENIYVVPSFYPPTHDSPVEYIHIRNQKCLLAKCKEKKSKLHTLTKKEAPICLHTVLIHSMDALKPSSSTALVPSSSNAMATSSSNAPKTKKHYPKLNRELSTKVVMDKISEHFPTMTKMESTGFVKKSRRYVEKLVSSKNINQTIMGCSRNFCTSCQETILEDWPFKPKQAFLLSLGHMVKIEIPVKFCRKCRRIFYPGKFSLYKGKYVSHCNPVSNLGIFCGKF
jgi:hypothetical protein